MQKKIFANEGLFVSEFIQLGIQVIQKAKLPHRYEINVLQIEIAKMGKHFMFELTVMS